MPALPKETLAKVWFGGSLSLVIPHAQSGFWFCVLFFCSLLFLQKCSSGPGESMDVMRVDERPLKNDENDRVE